MEEDKDIAVLANYIINSIETEDFIYSVKHFFYYKMSRLLKTLILWWDDV